MFVVIVNNDCGRSGLDPQAGQIGRKRLATAATFLGSCVAQELSRGDGPRDSFHASAYYREYSEDLIF